MKTMKMVKPNSFMLILVLSCFFHISFAQKTPYGNNPDIGKYASVNGVKIYYEIYGEGEPLLLIHGNGGSIKSHAVRIEHYSKNYRVIIADNRAHGKSQDLGDSLTYNNMTKDLNDLLDHLGVDSCLVWGQSDGGIIGLQLAMSYPKKVKKLAVFGANVQADTNAVHASIAGWVNYTIKNSKDEHEKRLFKLMRDQPQHPFTALESISAPVLIMSGDRDAIKLEHSLKIFQHIPNSNLFVMPGATHFGAYEKTELFFSVLDNFFTQPFSKKATTDIFK